MVREWGGVRHVGERSDMQKGSAGKGEEREKKN